LTLRKWFHLFWTTMAIGVFFSVAIGLVMQFTDREIPIPGISGLGFNVVNMILGGALISVLSQMGFFSFLIVRFIAIGIIRNKVIWDLIQLALTIVAIIDLAYLRYSNFQGASILSYSVMPLCILLVSLGVAYWKVKLTNKNAFIPTLFFMVAVTILEAVPAYKLNNAFSNIYMLIPLLACNSYQILNLHKFSANKKS
jgi:KinB signaling pathway activation protein